MKILRGVLQESRDYYLSLEKQIEKKLACLPSGSIKRRRIGRKRYYYLQFRKGGRVVHEYLGKEEPKELLRDIDQRRLLARELKKVKEALAVLKKSVR